MTLDKDTLNELIENGPYAWPGGYPIYFITDDGDSLSFKAVKDNLELIVEASPGDSWCIEAYDVNWENPNLYCDHTGELIESAYVD